MDSRFLCLDIGTTGVRGVAHRVQSGNITKSATAMCDSFDTVFAIKSVTDELEHELNTHFDSAYITGNFGNAKFQITQKHTVWNTEHKITQYDVQNQIAQIDIPDGYYPMHTIPLAYNTPGARDILTPIGQIDRELISAFGTIFYESGRLDELRTIFHKAHIQNNGFFDPQFLQNAVYRQQKQNTLFIDIGGEFTTASIWTNRGCVWFTKIPNSMTAITMDISEKLGIDFDEAERIKRNVASLIPKEMDRFTPADTEYAFQRSDVNDIVIPHLVDIIGKIKEQSATAIEKYNPTKIILTGGGASIDGVIDFFENAFGISGEKLQTDTSVNALSEYIWKLQEPKRNIIISRYNRVNSIHDKIHKIFKRRKPKQKFIPILPSTLCFNMRKRTTYELFNAGGISMIHVDIMDGFYVNKIAGSINELKIINANSGAHLHVHLMTESPSAWAADAITAGADTVIISTNTSGVKNALHEIKTAGKRCGIALNPESSVEILKPILRNIDEVMVMAVPPGSAGQSFNPDVLHKISILAATRKKYGLKFLISVDGGINNKTAQMCWNAGADLLVSGSYLAKSSDFPLAVQSLLKHNK
ncbi:MAG: ribulose-phosphate 3-epimerase [Proteobacteria bacterium]|nr:ribulose-phosphate 3-epimerase [Candidatus Enterousia scatequi]